MSTDVSPVAQDLGDQENYVSFRFLRKDEYIGTPIKDTTLLLFENLGEDSEGSM